MNPSLFFVLKVVIVIAVIVIFVFYNMSNKPSITIFPPWKSKCPDLWEIIDNNKCKNIHMIGKCSKTGDRIMDFNEPIFKTKRSDYYKCKWSKECGVAWERIDNLCI
jgi:hypothetical protein